MNIPAEQLSVLAGQENFQHFFTKPQLTEINMSTFILSQQLYPSHSHIIPNRQRAKRLEVISQKPGMFNAQLDGSFSEQKKLINELYSYHKYVSPLMKKTEQIVTSLVSLYCSYDSAIERTNWIVREAYARNN